MNATKLGFIAVIVLMAGMFAYIAYSMNSGKKLAFIELNKVFVEFEMKKELEAKVKSVQQRRNNIIDSLKLELGVLSRQIEDDNETDKNKISVFSLKREKFYELEKQFDEANLNEAKQFDNQIFTQINQYVKDYGTKKNYSVILGADGSGTLMFADEALNITEDIKLYINERYKGKSKE